ncbi:hypothetical protein DITRI_Ditri13aG0064700 [Diplodiscus trichospermus]
MEAFRSAAEDCGLEDLGFVGKWYTWEKDRSMENNIREWLDNALGSKKWCGMFPNYIVKHLTTSISDPDPILMDTKVVKKSRVKGRKRKSMFEAMWVNEPECGERVDRVWKTYRAHDLSKKVEEVQADLRKLHKVKFTADRESYNG